MAEVTKAAFGFESYKIPSFNFNESPRESPELTFDFIPSGQYSSKTGKYDLTLKFRAFEIIDSAQIDLVNTTVVATFKFKSGLPFSELPDYFYGNAIAIVFPYVRSFVSVITLQSNTGVLMLNPLNLTNLATRLKESSTHVE